MSLIPGKLIAACALMLTASPQLAAQVLMVEGVVSPAWLERAGQRGPLTAGLVLAGKDIVMTGPGARALLRLAEGSAVKLGENARLGVDTLLDRRGTESRLVGAALDVARGAFRFTTGVFATPPAGRDVKIRVSAVTAGIRGTDVWGKSEPERDIVCLLEGRIDVEHGGRQFQMQEPLSFFIAPRAGEPAPVAPVSRAQVDTWAEETDIRAGSGSIRRDGKFGVDVLVTGDGTAAQQGRDRLREAGYPAAMETVRDSYGAVEYRVHIDGAASAGDARTLAEKLKTQGYAGAAAR